MTVSIYELETLKELEYNLGISLGNIARIKDMESVQMKMRLDSIESKLKSSLESCTLMVNDLQHDLDEKC